MPGTAERLNALNRRLAMLLGERRALQYRWTLAATKANDWPDMRRAVELSIQPAADARAVEHRWRLGEHPGWTRVDHGFTADRSHRLASPVAGNVAYYHALLSFEDEPKTVRCMFADLSESELRTQPVYNMLDLAPQGRGSWYASLDYGTRVNR